jgi:hypothetical protein
MSCPELNLSVEPGTLGGRFTTIEGLLTQVRDDLKSSIFDAGDGGDSMNSESKQKWTTFFHNLTAAINGEDKFTITLEDPLASSYVQSFTAPEPDPKIKVEDYERTEAEEEELGLSDIRGATRGGPGSRTSGCKRGGDEWRDKRCLGRGILGINFHSLLAFGPGPLRYQGLASHYEHEYELKT